jgi:hypothetical protein
MWIAEDEDADESLDFKPYFDMVVGILFLLLIIISAQLFFTRYGDAAQQAEVESARRTELMRRWSADIDAFLSNLAQSMTERGIPATADQPGRRILVPMERLLATAQPSGGLEPEKTSIAIATSQLFAAVACASPQSGIRLSGLNCPQSTLRLETFGIDVLMIGPSPRQDLAPDRFAAAAAAVIRGAFSATEPRLFRFVDASGNSAMTSGSEVFSVHPGALPQALLQMRFRFASPL